MCSSRNINEGNLSSLLLATNKRWRKFKSASSWTASRSCNGKLLTPKATPETRQQPEGAAHGFTLQMTFLQNHQKIGTFSKIIKKHQKIGIFTIV